MSCGCSDALEEYRQTISGYLKAIVEFWEARATGQQPSREIKSALCLTSINYAKIPRSILIKEFKLPPAVAMTCRLSNEPIQDDESHQYWMWLFSLMHYAGKIDYLIRLFRVSPYKNSILILTDEKWRPLRAIHESPAFQDGHAEYLIGLCKLRWGSRLESNRALLLVAHCQPTRKRLKLDDAIQLRPRKNSPDSADNRH
ncbi:MAG: hypothetical protein WCT16_02030 [Candidatus Buchananbacteria bacterium]